MVGDQGPLKCVHSEPQSLMSVHTPTQERWSGGKGMHVLYCGGSHKRPLKGDVALQVPSRVRVSPVILQGGKGSGPA